MAFKIGLTGSIGSGKSTVLRILKEKGSETFSCDQVIHQIYNNPKHPVYKKILKVLPGGAEKKEIMRKKLGRIVFNDKEQLKKLEQIIHPVIIKRLEEWLKSQEEKEVLVAEVPLLFEKKLNKLFDKILLVKSQKDILFKRLKRCYKLSYAEINSRLSLSLPVEEKEKRSDYVLVNNSGLSKLKKEVDLLWQKVNRI